jgi:hypothetical protein
MSSSLDTQLVGRRQRTDKAHRTVTILTLPLSAAPAKEPLRRRLTRQCKAPQHTLPSAACERRPSFLWLLLRPQTCLNTCLTRSLVRQYNSRANETVFNALSPLAWSRFWPTVPAADPQIGQDPNRCHRRRRWPPTSRSGRSCQAVSERNTRRCCD